MALDPSIILAGRTPNPMGAAAQGAQTAQFVNDARHTNSYRNALREYGPGAFQGDPNAMNQLAAYDPQGMLGMRTTMNAEQRAAEQHRLALAQYTSGLDAASAKAERDRIVQGLSGAAYFYQRGDEQGYNAWLQQQGLDPAEYPMAQFEPIAMQFAPVLEALDGVIERNAGAGDPQFRAATPEEAARFGAAAGQIDTETGRFHPITPPSGMTLRTTPDGGLELVQGAGVGGDAPQGKPTEGGLASAGYLSRMRAAEGILNTLAAEGVEVPTIGALFARGSDFGGLVMSGQQQRLAQAMSDWVRAKLRKESGAMIGDEEMAAEIRTYFPMPGEGPETIAQKRRARKEAERQFEIMSGPAAPMAGGAPAAPTAPPPSAPPAAPGGAVSAPTPGVTEDGYMFTGGNPADPQNWKKVD